MKHFYTLILNSKKFPLCSGLLFTEDKLPAAMLTAKGPSGLA